MVDDEFTGRIDGIPSFQAGKVQRLNDWLQEWNAQRSADTSALSLQDSVFYSDSFNDLPLLECATRAVAVDPDERLRAIAQSRGWPVISLRE
jgi:phosphoserine phosphatase